MVFKHVSKERYIEKYEKRGILEVEENAGRLSGAAARTGDLRKKEVNKYYKKNCGMW